MSSKIRIKMGVIEVEYEGSEDFLKKELPELLSAVSQLYAQNGSNHDESPISDDSGTGNKHSSVSGTTATIAGKLGCKTAPDLIVAAAAHLALVGNKVEFSRKDLFAQIKSASGYYKTSMGKNLTNYLNNRLKSGDLVEPRTGYFALSSKKLAELRKTLAA